MEIWNPESWLTTRGCFWLNCCIFEFYSWAGTSISHYEILFFLFFCDRVFNFRQIVMYHFIWITSHIESCHPLKCLSALFFLRKLFFWPIMNILIVLQSEGSKYLCITLKLKLHVISVLACIGESMYRSSNCY